VILCPSSVRGERVSPFFSEALARITSAGQMAITTVLGTGGTVINGNRGNSNNLTVDGGFNLDSGSNGRTINNVGIDFIEQVAIQTSNFAADKGRNSGASINVVTKSGTNRYGGSVFEPFRDQSLDQPNHFPAKDASGTRLATSSTSGSHVKHNSACDSNSER